MKVEHVSYCSSNDPEYQAAEKLKQQFEHIDNNGYVLITSGIKMPPGCRVKDLDIVVAGYFKDYYIEDFQYPRYFNGYRSDKSGVRIQSFLVTIELKGFILEQIDIHPFGNLTAKYKKDPDDKSVSDQSHKQKHALRTALVTHLRHKFWHKDVDVYVYNLIWLNRIEKTNFYAEYGQHDEWNILAGKEISINELLKAIAFSGESAIWEDDHYLVNSFRKVSANPSLLLDNVKEVCDILGKSKSAQSNLTRHKLEAIAQNFVEDTKIELGKITVLKGRAGTGKTIRLLQFARQCCELNQKCVFLTYNLALVGDIRRLLAFTDFYDDSLMRIETMHYFFSEIMKLYGIDNAYINDENFEEIYNIRLGELKTKIEETKQPLDWDFVLVDEAQDWTTNEIDVLISLFSLEQIVIADGVDQFVRSTKKNAWNDAGNDLFHINYTKSLRQKSNLVAFVNAFAQKAGIDWQVEENEKLMGGRVIIAPAISAKLLQEVKDDCLGKENALYDILVLLTSDASQPKFMAQMLPLWKHKGVPLFDGTNKKNRELLSLNVDEARVFHYNSCRGIEGWSVFCTDLDVLVRERFISKKYPPRRIGETDYDRRMRIMKDIYMWILMPLTRAIDTLVITIREEKSEIGQLLYELSKMYDFVEWRIH